METMHALRDECGLADDAEVIDAFEATEDANYSECKRINDLLREEATLAKEQEKLLAEAKEAAEHLPKQRATAVVVARRATSASSGQRPGSAFSEHSAGSRPPSRPPGSPPPSAKAPSRPPSTQGSRQHTPSALGRALVPSSRSATPASGSPLPDARDSPGPPPPDEASAVAMAEIKQRASAW